MPWEKRSVESLTTWLTDLRAIALWANAGKTGLFRYVVAAAFHLALELPPAELVRLAKQLKERDQESTVSLEALHPNPLAEAFEADRHPGGRKRSPTRRVGKAGAPDRGPSKSGGAEQSV